MAHACLLLEPCTECGHSLVRHKKGARCYGNGCRCQYHHCTKKWSWEDH